MNKSGNRNDVLERYKHDKYLHEAKALLQMKEQPEEAYLGALAVLMMKDGQL